MSLSLKAKQIPNYEMPAMQAATEEYLQYLMGSRFTLVSPIAEQFKQDNISLLDIACNYGARISKKNDPTMEYAVSQALSSSDFPAAIATSTQKVVMRSYNAKSEHTKFLAKILAPDYKAMQFPDLDMPDLVEVIGENGEIPMSIINATAGGEEAAIKEFARVLNLSHKLIRNLDAIDALTLISKKMGDSVARLHAKRAYTVLESNPVMADSVAMFDESKGNVIPGHSTLNLTAFKEGMSALRTQPNIAGDPVNNALKHVVCTPVQEYQVMQYVHDIGKEGEISVTAAPWVTSGCYLFADPEFSPTMALFNFGGEAVQVVSHKRKLNERGMRLGFYSDFEVAPVSRIGAVKIPTM